jgi:hypothetical protein
LLLSKLLESAIRSSAGVDAAIEMVQCVIDKLNEDSEEQIHLALAVLYYLFTAFE